MARDDKLLRYTEAAIALLGGVMPDVCYVPPDIREEKKRISADGLATEAPYGDKEIIKRIAASDPLGLLIAIMNGQPIPGFRIVQKGEPAPRTNKGGKPLKKGATLLPEANAKIETTENGADIYVEYYSPTLGHRERVAQYLLANILPAKRAFTGKKDKPEKIADDYEALIKRRAAEAGDE